MLRAVTAALALVATAAGAVRGQQSTRDVAILGSVFDTVGAPVADVEVALLGTGVVRRTDGGGEFRLPAVRAGRYVLRARRLGYVSKDIAVDGSAGDTLTLTLNLVPAAPVLTPVVVEERETPTRLGKLAGFYERMRTAASPPSSFVTREQIDRMNPRRVSDIVKSRGPRAEACLAGKVYVDGALVASPLQLAALQNRVLRQARREGQRGTDGARPAPRPRPEDAVDFIQPDHVEAMEIYRGAAQVPPQYNVTADPGMAPGCVVLIWTR
jgi:hypothetical protein